MKIILENVGKRYRHEWVFRNINFELEPSLQYTGIVGSNGSGKSTLMKVLSGHLSPSKGKVRFLQSEKEVAIDNVYKHVSFAAPYIDVIEELSLEEAVAFHTKVKPLFPGVDTARIIDLLALPRARKKEVRYFSSGMKQRLKLALAICSDTPVLLLDEPSTNLDQQGIAWYKELLGNYAKERIVIIASNDQQDLEQCKHQLDILAFKTKSVGRT